MKKIFIYTLLLIVLILIALPFYYNTEKLPLNDAVREQQLGEFIQLSQGVTHYQQANPEAQQVVVLVHGFSVPYYIWEPTFEMLKANGFRVIRYDLYGRGFSDRPEVVYDAQLFDRQLMDLLAALKITQPIDIVGLSMGGAITAKFVGDHPEKINKVVFVDPSHEAWHSKIVDTPLLGEYIATVYMLPKSAESQLGDFNDPSKFKQWPAKYREQMQYYGFRHAILSTLRNFLNYDKIQWYQKVGQLHKPTLLIWGRDDQTLPFANSPRVAKALGVDTFVVEDAGHISHFERPEIVNPKLLSFLKEN
jgi:pimeloyl-ACP methyl ester carboxylesterase